MTDAVVSGLVEDPRVTDVTLVRGAGVDPPRDVVEADVAREAASDVLGTLTRMGLGSRGGISMTETTVDTPSDTTAHALDIAVIGGDGIGPEVVTEGLKVLGALGSDVSVTTTE